MIDLKLEKYIFAQQHKSVGGIDEVGRGPLAGPVVSACVICEPGFEIKNEKLKLINDSKKLTEKRREELYDVIMDEFENVGIGYCDHTTIDRINILQATFLSMKKAIGALRKKPEYILVDGKFIIPNMSYPQKAIIKGDSSVFVIAVASIVAKVTRDRMMKEFHNKYPNYGFDKHKGYGTKVHLENIKKFGPCEIHRRSFAPIKNNY